MDKRYKPLTLSQQMELRQQVMNDLLSHPEWSLQEAVCHLKKGLRLTTADLAKLAGVSPRTVQDIERGVSQGTVQTLDRILGVLGLRLSVAAVQGLEQPGV
ncbi:helix-turn-helix transcriptional regulator [Thiobacillus sp.]|uniref:helix-turn-helix domain-containing protein n=1 Tax=Thiobacillus sp. TaxID=924 RepID=UPI0025FCE27B|nr:helix-turn-helix transcriptional regulator [Thiobacillus sp.]